MATNGCEKNVAKHAAKIVAVIKNINIAIVTIKRGGPNCGKRVEKSEKELAASWDFC